MQSNTFSSRFHLFTFSRALAAVVLTGAVLPALAADGPANLPSTAEVRATLTRGIEFLLKDQNPDGSWGSFHNAYVGLDDAFMNLPSQRAFTVGTTALGCLAMAETEQTPA